MHNGDYENAAAVYRSLLTRSLDADTTTQAQLGLGKAHLQNGEYAKAIPILRELLDDPAGSDANPETHFLLAEALIGAGEPLSASEAYSAYLSSGTVITPYVNRWLGDALYTGGAYLPATNAYEGAIAEAPDRSFEIDVREKLALTHVALQNYPASVEQYDAILEIAEQRATRARIEHQAAETLILAGQTEEGYERHRFAVETYPTEYYAYLSLVKLVEAGRPVNDFLRGVVDYYGGAYGPAVGALYRYIEANPETYSSDAHWYVGLSYLEAGSPELAAAEFERMIEAYPENEHWGDAWMSWAEAYLDMDEVDQAIEIYRRFAATASDHPRAPEALWEAGWWLENTGDLETAAEVYFDCHVGYPDSDYGASALFRSGLQSYQLEELVDAAVAWDTLTQIYPDSPYRPKALLWLGKLRLAQDDPEAAREAFAKAQAADPMGYYGLRAADLAADPDAPSFPSTPYSTIQQNPDRGTEFAEWLGMDILENGDPRLDELNPELAADPRFRRGQELWQLGRFVEAKGELEALRRATAYDAQAQYQLALVYGYDLHSNDPGDDLAPWDIDLYRSSILCAAQLVRLSPVTHTIEAPISIARLVYPTYYESLVMQNTRWSDFGLRDLDPLLVFAVVRQESLFESLAASYVGAHGLMQVMPATGADIAAELDWPPDYETEDLYRPYVSLRFGTYYLAQQLERFDGRIDVALAAYNAGPFRAARWLDRSGDDPDLFLELVTLEEPRLYIRRVREHLAAYQLLYSE